MHIHNFEEFVRLWNLVSSAIVVVGCYWLAHQYAAGDRVSRTLSMAFAVLGMTILLTAIGRQFYTPPEAMIALSKTTLAYILYVLGRRNRFQPS